MTNALKLSNKPAMQADIDLGTESALTEEQINTISHVSLFKEIAGIYKSKGMSEWGGLALFSGEFILIGIDSVNKKKSLQATVYELIEKLSFTVINLAASAQKLKLTQPDIRAVDFAFKAAEKWIDMNPLTKASECLMNEVEQTRSPNEDELSDRLTKTKIPIDKNDPEFDRKYLLLESFLTVQEMLLRGGESKVSFADEKEKTRYIHFVFGAIDQLSRTIKDEKRSELWGMTTSIGRATVLFGIDEALDHVESFGRTGDDSIEAATKSGWTAMRNFILALNGKVSKEDDLKNSLSLFKVVREQE